MVPPVKCLPVELLAPKERSVRTCVGLGSRAVDAGKAHLIAKHTCLLLSFFHVRLIRRTTFD